MLEVKIKQDSPWLTPPEAAQYARRPLKTIRKAYNKTGKLRHIRLESGRVLIKRAWLDDYLESFEVDSSVAGEELKESMRGRE